MEGVPHIKFGGEKFVRLALFKEADGIIKRQKKEIDGFDYVLENRNELGWQLQKANEEIAKLHEENKQLNHQLSELISAIYEFEEEGTYLYDLAENYEEDN